MRRLALTLGSLLPCFVSLFGCTKPDKRSSASVPTPEPRIVYVVVTPSQAPQVPRDAEPTWTPDPDLVLVTPTEAPTAPPPPTPRPTVDISAIPSLERPMGPPADAKSRSDQLAGCMTYSAEPDPGGQWVRVRVTGHNSCNQPVTSDESWFEITATDSSGAQVGREVGRFQNVIPIQGQAQTYIALDCPKEPCRYKAAAWWAAGGGRGPQ